MSAVLLFMKKKEPVFSYEYLLYVLIYITVHELFVCVPVPFVFPHPSKTEIMYKYKVNENLNVVYEPKFSALSNGCFPRKLSPIC